MARRKDRHVCRAYPEDSRRFRGWLVRFERGADSNPVSPAGNQVEHAGWSQVNVRRSSSTGIDRIALDDRWERERFPLFPLLLPLGLIPAEGEVICNHTLRARQASLGVAATDRLADAWCDPCLRGVADYGNLREMQQEPATTAELLAAWREATRAAELAERLSQLAAETADRAEANAFASEEIADMAEEAAAAATRAAERARAAAVRAREVAGTDRNDQLAKAAATETQARAVERDAQAKYHEVEAEVRRKMK